MEQAVSQEGFMSAVEHHGFPLSRSEADMLFNRLARRKLNQPPSLSFEDFQACMMSLPNPLPQAQWGRDLIKSVDKITRSQGTPLENLFKQLGAESVAALDVQAVLSRYSPQPLSTAQWSNLLPLLDKKPDGSVLWPTMLRWAGVETSST
ncbi:Wdr35 [Symbiodinium natans]|uniref:Wdr35 protein n=1 Tax=Symbiodinium natans TaxID=878477 RepID=A0A812TPB3_9DINO|nr:Wdr35 [Symbiodinium natans]